MYSSAAGSDSRGEADLVKTALLQPQRLFDNGVWNSCLRVTGCHPWQAEEGWANLREGQGPGTMESSKILPSVERELRLSYLFCRAWSFTLSSQISGLKILGFSFAVGAFSSWFIWRYWRGI